MRKDNKRGLPSVRALWLLPTVFLLVFVCGYAQAMSERALSQTKATVDSVADREFNASMATWFSHDYDKGFVKLQEFSKSHPNSRWAAEADLHCGCYLTFKQRYDEAKPIFENVLSKYPNTNVAAKAKLRLGNIAERTGHFDEAIKLYTATLKMKNLTWDQFKYANYYARRLTMAKHALQGRINCGPVALAACLRAMGKTQEAESTKNISVGEDGMSLSALTQEATKLGVNAQAAEIQFSELPNAALPVVAHIAPSHYVAVLSIKDGKAEVEDSIVGKREIPLAALANRWSGRVLSFAPKDKVKSLEPVIAMVTVGGCCGQADEDECKGDPCKCKQGSTGGNGAGGGAGGAGGGSGGAGGSCGFGCGLVNHGITDPEIIGPIMDPPAPPTGGKDPCCEEGGDSKGRPTWRVNTNNLNLMVTDTPAWYVPSKGPVIAFTLKYSNENSNSGLFGNGWRCPYDMHVFYGVDQVQLHRADGSIETYNLYGDTYYPRNPSLGYSDKFEILDATTAQAEGVPEGTARLTYPDGGKNFFLAADSGLANGCISAIQDPVGNRVNLTYDSSGDLTSITDATGKTTTITWTNDGSDRVAQITLPSGDGRTASLRLDANGNLIGITDMLGAPSTLSYGASIWGTTTPYNWPYGEVPSTVPYLSTIETPAGKTKFTYEWWTFDWVEWPVAALHEVFEVGPNENYPTGPNAVPTIHYAWCSATYAEYTAVTRYPSTVVDSTAGCVGEGTHWTGGETTIYHVSPSEDMLGSIEDPLHHYPLTYEYDSSRQRTVVKDGNGNETTYTYDGSGNIATKHDPSAPAGQLWHYTYDDFGHVLTETDPLGRVFKAYTYNTLGQLLTMETELTAGVRSVLQTRHYNSQHHVDYVEDGNHHRTTWNYDANTGYLTSIVDPKGKTTTYRHDAAGRVDQVTSPNGKVTTIQYDQLDRKAKVIHGTDPDTDPVNENHFTCCHADWQKDANGVMTRFEYDSKNRLYAEIGGAIDSSLAAVVGLNDTVINIQQADASKFPAHGVISVVAPDGSGGEIMTYDAKNGNQLTSVHRARFGTSARMFTVADRVTVGRVASKVYDSQFLSRKIAVYDPDEHLTQYAYYADGHLSKVTNADGTWEQYTYDAAGNMTKKEIGHDTTTTKTTNYKYDAGNRLISMPQ